MLLAWLLATGSQWDLAQTFAWGRMIAGYSRTMPLLEAVRLTFTPGNECDLCNAVDAARQQPVSPATPEARLPGKILLAFQPAPKVIFSIPSGCPWPLVDEFTPGVMRASPPVPPPRAV